MILTPYTVSRMYQSGITDILSRPFAWGWAAMVTIAPLLVIGGVIFANPGVVGIKGDSETTVITPAKTPEPLPVVSETVQETPKTNPNGHKKGFQCPDCPRVFDTWNGLSGHKKVHRKETVS